jgi:hypothetical protein
LPFVDVAGMKTPFERRAHSAHSEAGVAATVQVDDGYTGGVADVVDGQRMTTSVARIPRAR